MDALLLSIVIPVYNVEPYIAECLSSVVNQSLDDALYEILVVDDKSTDNSLAVCREFADRHANIRIFALPENTPGGAGIPSNVGIRNAGGKYIGFVDSDDVADPAMFAELTALAEQEQADLALCSFMTEYLADGSLYAPHDTLRWQRLFEPGFAGLSPLEQKRLYLRIAPVPWRKLYRREFLVQNNILFPEGDFFYEDHPLHWYSIVQAKRIAALDKMFIRHRQNRPGQTTAAAPGRASLQMVEHFRAIQNFLRDKGVYADYKDTFFRLAGDVMHSIPEGDPLRDRVEGMLSDIWLSAEENTG
jgi:glycosyltransferase involved in cell wall biosynthesis